MPSCHVGPMRGRERPSRSYLCPDLHCPGGRRHTVRMPDQDARSVRRRAERSAIHEVATRSGGDAVGQVTAGNDWLMG
ncbi:hypothetical protein BN2537_10605 [Streptomyces venezuelae]|nr:hypothetical protein BN2537_10605 [Streptomyces venezuelae]